jgi:hypothetical protein
LLGLSPNTVRSNGTAGRSGLGRGLCGSERRPVATPPIQSSDRGKSNTRRSRIPQPAKSRMKVFSDQKCTT